MRGEEKEQKTQLISGQGPIVCKELKNPDDGGRVCGNQADLENQKPQKSENRQINSSQPNESNQTGPNSQKNREEPVAIENNTPQHANESEKISKPVPEQKLADLQAVINSIDHYQIDMEEMARDQPLDPEFQRISREAATGLHFRKIKIGNSELFVDISNGPARPFVPTAWRRRVFDIVHGLGHPGVERTRQAVSSKFVWPSMKQDCSRWARECIPCQRAKVTRHTTPPIGDFELPQRRFAHIHADLVAMPVSNGFNHLLTIVDRFTRWPTAIPIRDISAETVIDALALNWIAQHGVPETITTDRGSQFTSEIWKQLLQTWGVKHSTTTAYHPQSNGLVERLHRRLKESLIALCQDERDRWFWKLPMTLLALRTTVKPDIGACPSDLVYGEGISVPGQLTAPNQLDDADMPRQQRSTLRNLRIEVERLQPRPTSHHRRPQVHIPEELATATHVLVQRGGVQQNLTAPYDGPFRVLERGPQGFRVQFPGRSSDIVALARLKPAFVNRDTPANDSDSEQDLDDNVPPSPPPPGRRPGLRTRVPDPTTRVTRSQRQNTDFQPQPSTSSAADEPTCAPPQRSSSSRSVTRPRSPSPDSSQESVASQAPPPQAPPYIVPPHLAPPSPPVIRDPQFPDGTPDDPNLAIDPTPPRDWPDWISTRQQNNRQPTRFFSRPKPGHFSHQRRRPDVNALKKILFSIQ